MSKKPYAVQCGDYILLKFTLALLTLACGLFLHLSISCIFPVSIFLDRHYLEYLYICVQNLICIFCTNRGLVP